LANWCSSKGIEAMRLPSLKKLLKSERLGRFLADDEGVTAIEFAFLGPLFGIGLLVTFETSIMLFTEYVIQTSVQEAARLVRTGQAQDREYTAQEFKDAVCYIAKYAMNCDANLTVYMKKATSFTALEAATPSYLTITGGAFGLAPDGTPKKPPYECGGPSEAIALIATYDWRIATPWVMDNFANVSDSRTRRLVGFAMFRNEPFPIGGKSCK
jgi:Flp pilus assembly pilin Flp